MLMIIVTQLGQSQDSTFVIDFDRVINWVKMNNTLPYLSKEEKERLNFAYGKVEGYLEKYMLQASDNQYYYFTDNDFHDDKYQWSSKKEAYHIYRNLNDQTQKCMIETLSKVYWLEGEIIPYKWKILTEIKEVNGYICMKAETKDTTKNQKIIAWFTDQIPISAGPELFCGLPGMILEVDINDGATVLSATKVTVKKSSPLTLPKKWKGKKISHTEFNQIINKYVKECIAANRNPYWAIRY